MSGRRLSCCRIAFRLTSWMPYPIWSVFTHRLRKLITAVEGHYPYPCLTENIPKLVNGCSEGAACHGAGFHAGDQPSGWFEQSSSFLPQPFRVVDPLLAAMEV